MKKIVFEFLITFCFFACLWFGLAQVDWVSIFKIRSLSEQTEEQLGDFSWQYFNLSNQEIDDEEIVVIVDSLVTHITQANGIDRHFIKVHLVATDQINAFALPNGHLVLNSQLILDAENQEELLGVIAHELAHIELNHVTEKWVKEIGLTVAVAAVTGRNNELIGKFVKLFTSTAFDRHQEEEADLTALVYLEKADVNPLYFANFLKRLSDGDSRLSEYFVWMNTHPNSKQRANAIRSQMDAKKSNYLEVIDLKTWSLLQERLNYLGN